MLDYYFPLIFALKGIFPLLLLCIASGVLWWTASGKTVQKKVIAGVVFFYALYSGILTVMQYFVWAGDEKTKLFTILPVEINDTIPDQLLPVLGLFDWPGGYFAIYSLYHFWFSLFLTLVSSFLFTGILFILARYRPQLFFEGELLLIFLCLFLSGWPMLVVLIPLAFLIAIAISLAQTVVQKQSTITVGLSFALGLFILSALSLFIDPIAFLHLSVFRV